MTEKTRIEKDSLGELEVPAGAYYGIQTLRAGRNFPISGLRSDPALVEALIQIKKAAALSNASLGHLSEDRAAAVVQACDEVLSGKWRDQFIVDVFQMGAGTSLHMNCNEVLANRASEILGGGLGEYRLVHPNDDINKGQSTNDVFPTAMRLSVLRLLRDNLRGALEELAASFTRKGEEFRDIVKSGRTHLQDAPPVRLGGEFKAYARTLEKARESVSRAADSLRELGIGGSAVGTGLNTCRDYPELMVEHLSRLTELSLTASPDLQEAMQSMHPFSEISAALRNLALELNRIANDLRLLASGPRTGFSEISLPAVAPGSSIMPGKVNPSMLEMLNMVCYQVFGCDGAVSAAVQAGQLELNVMMPVIAFNLHFMIRILGNALREVRKRCIEGIEADPDRCRNYAFHSLGIAAALTPQLGYAKASEIAKRAAAGGESLVDIVLEKGLFTREELESLLDPGRLTEPGPCRPKNENAERD
jgi:aspartate ammonia-lyase